MKKSRVELIEEEIELARQGKITYEPDPDYIVVEDPGKFQNQINELRRLNGLPPRNFNFGDRVKANRMASKLRHRFLKTALFKKYAGKLKAWRDIDELKRTLDVSPDSGDVIPGGDGLRKIRMPLASQNKGALGGARVIYYLILDQTTILFLDLFAKNEKEDLTKDELNILIAAKNEIVAELRTKKS